MKPILLKDLLFESVDYKVPASPKFLLYDFYVLSYIRTLNINPHEKGFVGRFNQPESLKADIDHATQMLLPHLKKHILEVLFFCICAEVRHFLGYSYNTKNKDLVRDRHPVFDEYIEAYRIVRYGKYGADTPEQYYSIQREVPKGEQRRAEYVRSWRAAKHAINKGYTAESFVRAAYDAFDNTNEWETEYGGNKWQDICEAWEMLNEANDYNKISIAIDHIYDLQHNTGFVLNKVPEYRDSWVKIALDKKAHVKDIRQLFPMCSSDMRKLGQQAVRAAGFAYQPADGQTDPLHPFYDEDDGKI